MKLVLSIIVPILFLSVFVIANVYLGNNLAASINPALKSWFRVGFPLLTFGLMWAGMGLTNSTSLTGHAVYVVAFVLIGFWLYLLIATLTVDLLSLAINVDPQLRLFISYGLAALISIYGIWNATNLKIYERQIPIKGLNKTVKAAHLTDTHLGHFRGEKHLTKVVEAINSQDIDVVFFTGDLLDGRIQLKKESLAPLGQINAPVYFVEGNHDIYTGVESIKGQLNEIGIRVLTNQMVEWEGIQIIGLNHMIADSATYDMHAEANGPTVQNVLNRLPIEKDKPSILLHHGPAGIKYANEAGVDLYLAGHTHAGQMWPATHVAKAIFEYNIGLHDYKGTKIYVSQGTGTFGPPMRVGTESELAILTLSPN